ncbi:aspartate 1-decarboxylase [Chloroflexota bacterium]
MRVMLKSKIHRARVTGANISYEGSISIDKKLMAEADIFPYEQVQVLNINNGARFATYAIEGGNGEICLNGAAARQVITGDTVIILTYCHLDDDEAGNILPRQVYVDTRNTITGIHGRVEALSCERAK